MLRLELEHTYRFILESSKLIDITVHGTNAATDNITLFDITVDGVRGTYEDINSALSEPYVRVERL